MPYPNQHAARQNPPGKYREMRSSSDGYPDGISVVLGIKEDGKSEIQSVRFDASKWPADKARAWLKSHKMSTMLEVATGKRFDSSESSESESRFVVKSVQADQRLVTGWLYVSVDKAGNRMVDHSNQFVRIETLQKAAHGFVQNSRMAGYMHRKGPDGKVIKVGRVMDSCVFTPDIVKALEADGVLPQGWLVTMKIDDDATWEDIKSGKCKDLSFGGRARFKEAA